MSMGRGLPGAAAAALLTLAAAAPAFGEDRGALAALGHNASYTVESSLDAFTENYKGTGREVNDTAAMSWTRLTAASQTALGRDFTASFKLYGVLSSQEDERRGVFEEPGYRGPHPRFVDFQEAKVRWSHDDYDLSLGKILHSVGVANLYSPTNVFTNVDAANPMHPTQLGLWSTEADIDVGDDTLTFMIIPFQDRPGLPPANSRWLGTSGNYNFYSIDRTALGLPANSTLNIEDHYRASTPSNYGYLAHYKGSREGFDFFGVLYTGPSPYPVLRANTAGVATQLLKETPPAFEAGSGVSLTRGAWAYYGEAIVQDTYNGRDQNFLKYVVGTSYRETDFAERLGLQEIDPILEYAGEGTMGNQTATGFVADSRNARPGRDTLFVRLGITQSENWSYTLGIARNIHERDTFWAAGAEYRINDDVRVRGDVRIFSGPENTQFGRWDRNDHSEMTLIAKF